MTTKITGDNITDGSVTTEDLNAAAKSSGCLLYTSPSPRDLG